MIRRATRADAPACAAILNAWIDATPWMPRVHPAADVLRHYADHVLPRQTVWVTGAPVSGFLALDEEEGCVTALYLAAEARGQGRGTALLDRAKRNRDALHLWTFRANAPARRFYAREGFAEDARSEGDNEEGLPDIRYRWPA